MEPNTENQKKSSLYIVLNPKFEVEYIRKFDSGWLFSFLEQEASHYQVCKDQDVPDNWMVEVRFKDEKHIPPLAENDNSRYFLDQIMPRDDFGTLSILSKRLRDAVFCNKNGIDPLSSQGDHDKLRNHPIFEHSAQRNEDRLVLDKSYEFPCWKALESERGVLLFSDSENGKLAERKYRQYIVDHFFDPKFNIEFLNEHRIPKFLTQYADYVDRFYDLRIKRIKEREGITPIPQSFFAPAELVRTGFCDARFNLMPTGQNFKLFAEGLKVSEKSSKLATLMIMAETGFFHPIRPEHNRGSSYLNEYKDLGIEIYGFELGFSNCSNEIRQFGINKLNTEFPGDFRGKDMIFLKEENIHYSIKIK